MKKIIPIYICAHQYDWEDEPSLSAYSFDASATDKSYVLMERQSIEFNMPDNFDMRPHKIAELEAQKKKAMADYELLMNTLDGKIASLKAIDHK